MTYYRNESGLVSAICKAIEKRWPQAWVLKVHGGPYQRAGVPDLLVSVQGRLVGIEVKHQKPGESPFAAVERTTLLQRAEMRKMTKSGAVAGVALSVDHAILLIENALR